MKGRTFFPHDSTPAYGPLYPSIHEETDQKHDNNSKKSPAHEQAKQPQQPYNQESVAPVLPIHMDKTTPVAKPVYHENYFGPGHYYDPINPNSPHNTVYIQHRPAQPVCGQSATKFMFYGLILWAVSTVLYVIPNIYVMGIGAGLNFVSFVILTIPCWCGHCCCPHGDHDCCYAEYH